MTEHLLTTNQVQYFLKGLYSIAGREVEERDIQIRLVHYLEDGAVITITFSSKELKEGGK